MNLYQNEKINEKIIEKVDKCFMNDDFFKRLDEHRKRDETNVNTKIPARLSRLIDFAHDCYMHGIFVGMTVTAEIEIEGKNAGIDI